jgi:hypothetical protein
MKNDRLYVEIVWNIVKGNLPILQAHHQRCTLNHNPHA